MTHDFIIFLDMKDIWLDCDPGHDDLMAIILALYHPEANLIGISTVDGNSTIDNVTQNALRILHQLGRDDIPVIKGAQSPLQRKNFNAPQIHGENGLAGAYLKEAPRKAIQGDYIEEISTRILKNENPVYFVATGPLTNLAKLLTAGTGIQKKIKEISIMGGAIGLGNISPAAQFNILVDPEAASLSIKKSKQFGITFRMVPLQVTHKTQANQFVLNWLKERKNQFSLKIYSLMKEFQKFYKFCQDFDYPPIHDPNAVLLVLRPDLYVQKHYRVQIQTRSQLSDGRTNVFVNSKQSQKRNVWTCVQVDSEKFWQQMLKCIQLSEKSK